MTDVIEKVEWLQKHDNMTQQLAMNAKVFADSYLRLEDYYCYPASALEILGNLMQNSDAMSPFQPKKIESRQDLHWLKMW